MVVTADFGVVVVLELEGQLHECLADVHGGCIGDVEFVRLFCAVGGDQVFTFIGSAAFTAPGQLRIVQRVAIPSFKANTNANGSTKGFELHRLGSSPAHGRRLFPLIFEDEMPALVAGAIGSEETNSIDRLGVD